MIQGCIAAVAICILVLMSVQANRRFKEQVRLPMQWALDGSVNWSAPRPIALAFTPILAAIVLSATAALITVVKARPGQEEFVFPALIFVAVAFIGAHAFHLWLIAKACRRNG